jgi:hypothetical protein
LDPPKSSFSAHSAKQSAPPPNKANPFAKQLEAKLTAEELRFLSAANDSAENDSFASEGSHATSGSEGSGSDTSEDSLPLRMREDSAPTTRDEIVSGFICPICKMEADSADLLQAHFEYKHAGDEMKKEGAQWLFVRNDDTPKEVWVVTCGYPEGSVEELYVCRVETCSGTRGWMLQKQYSQFEELFAMTRSELPENVKILFNETVKLGARAEMLHTETERLTSPGEHSINRLTRRGDAPRTARNFVHQMSTNTCATVYQYVRYCLPIRALLSCCFALHCSALGS